MLKIFSTQLNGLYKKIIEKEEFNLEDAARLLTQATVGDGIIYIHGFGEMDGVSKEALHGMEPLLKAADYNSDITLSQEDRFLLFSRYSNDQEAVQLAQKLNGDGIPFVAVSTIVQTETDSLETLADVHINLQVERGLIPKEDGNRMGYPTLLVALFVYFGIKFTIEEILHEYLED